MIERRIQNTELNEIVQFLQNLDLFKNLPQEILVELISDMSIVSIQGGETFIHQGEADPTLFILMHGRLRVFAKDAKKESQVEIADLSAGEVVGEMALLTGSPRTANVRAIRDSIVLKLKRELFAQFEKDHPEGVLQIAKTALGRMIRYPRPTQPGENVATIVMMPAGRTDHIPFTRRLVDELNRTKPTTLINAEICDSHFGRKISQTKFEEEPSHELNQWLTSLESRGGYVVYETDRELTPWTERCMRQGDRLFLVADTTLPFNMNAIERVLFQDRAPTSWTEIVFIHPENEAMVTGTRHWLATRPVNNYHHLHLSDDFARLCRFLTGRAFGVVLGGGGARGFAHAGVLKALAELGVPIDFIGGTSMGAVVAASYAKYGITEALKIPKRPAILGTSRDFTLPFVSLLKGKAVTKFFQDLFGETYIEDLNTRFFCVSTNVTELTQNIHKQGLIWFALRASTSIPALYPPLYDEDGNMLVDGGITNNLPVDIMRTLLGGGKILAVNCHIIGKSEHKKGIQGAWASGWDLILEQLNPFKKVKRDRDNIFNILRTSLSLSSQEHENRMAKEADYLMDLDMSRYGLLDLSNAEEIVEIGYRQAIERLPKILQLDKEKARLA